MDTSYLNFPMVVLVMLLLTYWFGQVCELPEGFPGPGGFRFGPKTYYISVKNDVYHINGNSRPNLRLRRGQTYYFELDGTTTRNYPMFFSTVPENGTQQKHRGELTYKHGVQGSKMQSGQIVFEVPDNFNVKEIFYHSVNRDGMGGRIHITD